MRQAASDEAKAGNPARQGRDTAEQSCAATEGHERTVGRTGDAGAVRKVCAGGHYPPSSSCERNPWSHQTEGYQCKLNI